MGESDPEKPIKIVKLDDLPIGTERLLTEDEQRNIDLLGYPREELAGMTPREISELLDSNSEETGGA